MKQDSSWMKKYDLFGYLVEIDKNATAVQINDFKIDSADGELYHYHFYLSDDGQNFNIIGSYDGSAGRSITEHGDNFKWENVDEKCYSIPVGEPIAFMCYATVVTAKAKEAIADKLTGNIVKEIYVPGRIVNIVMK